MTDTEKLDTNRLRELLAKATTGEWEVQDGCSWRRIGTHGHSGNVLCPDTYSREDRHPDLTAGKGEDLYANLNLIVAAVNALPALLSHIAILEETIAGEPGRVEQLKAQVAAYRLLAVNEGWSHRLVDAYGHKAYAAFRIDEVDAKAMRTVASGYDAAGWLRDHGQPVPAESDQ